MEDGFDNFDSDYMTTEQACDAGWLTPDDVDNLRDIIKTVDISQPAPDDRAMAALILIDLHLNPRPEIERIGTEPNIVWARALLDLE